MHELEMLQSSMAKLAAARTVPQRKAITCSVLLWGARTKAQVRTLEDLLTRQLEWLDSHEQHASYETRFADWITNLRLYERSCDALNQAQSFGEIAA
jgi:hypothetical protein